jgi:hypothetical protein
MLVACTNYAPASDTPPQASRCRADWSRERFDANSLRRFGPKQVAHLGLDAAAIATDAADAKSQMV